MFAVRAGIAPGGVCGPESGLSRSASGSFTLVVEGTNDTAQLGAFTGG